MECVRGTVVNLGKRFLSIGIGDTVGQRRNRGLRHLVFSLSSFKLKLVIFLAFFVQSTLTTVMDRNIFGIYVSNYPPPNRSFQLFHNFFSILVVNLMHSLLTR